jgi:hypothetical protein
MLLEVCKTILSTCGPYNLGGSAILPLIAITKDKMCEMGTPRSPQRTRWETPTHRDDKRQDARWEILAHRDNEKVEMHETRMPHFIIKCGRREAVDLIPWESIIRTILIPLICCRFSTIYSSTSSADEARRNSGHVPMRWGHYSTDMS